MALAVSPASGHRLSEEELRQMQNDAMTKLNELKLNDPDRFRTLIKQHLSYYTNELLDEDAEKAVAFVESSTNSCFADDAVSSCSSSTASQKAAALIRGALPRAKKTVKVRNDGRKVVIEHRHDLPVSTGPHDLFVSALTEETIAAADELIKFLDSPKMLATEGLFRLCGSKQRQELLKRELNRGASVEWNRLTKVDLVNAHDVATVLKQLLMSLKEPLIPEEHYPVYLDMIDFYDEGNLEVNSANADEQVDRKRAARRMNAVKILFLLTSREQLELAKLLLHFLKKVADEGANLMSEASLGTVFAPCLFHLTPTKRQEETGTYCRLGLVLAEMIRHSDRLFVAPNKLLNEVRRYCKQHSEEGVAADRCGFADFPPTPFSCSNQSPTKFFGRNFRKHTKKKGSIKRRSRSADDLEATVPPVQSAAAGDNITEMELAKLCAHIQAMPNNEKYVKKVNKLANKPLTPEPLKQTESMFPKFFRKNIRSAKASVNRECSPESLTETEHLTRRTVKQNVVKAKLKDQFHLTESSRDSRIDENRRVGRPESYLPNASISLDTPVKERRPGWFPHQGGDNAPLRSLNKPALRAEQKEKLRLTRTSETLPPAKRLQGMPLPCLEEFQQRLTIPVGYDAGEEKFVPRSKSSVMPEENDSRLETMI